MTPDLVRHAPASATRRTRRVPVLATLFGLVATLLLPSAPALAADPSIWVPTQVTAEVEWTDTYGAPRSGGRTHKGVDMMAPQMTPVFAAESGYIYRAYGGDSRECLDGGVCSSYGFLIYGDDGWAYFYLHLNNDTPGRPNGCDRAGGAEHAFSPRLVEIIRERGTLEPTPYRWRPENVVRVTKGELIGYLGSSGNAGCAVDHLHFEMWPGHDFKSANDPSKANPTPYVDAAYEAGRFHGDEWPLPDPVPTARFAGATRIETAIELARATYTQTETVLLAPAWVYPEALLAAPLGAALDGPVLLTRGENSLGGTDLDDGVAATIRELGARNVVIVGGTHRLSAELEDQVVGETGIPREQVTRIGGADRYELAAAIARELYAFHGHVEPAAEGEEPSQLGDILPRRTASEAPPTISPIVALGESPRANAGWPDALAASALAAEQMVPVILTPPDALPGPSRDALDHPAVGEVRIAGGAAAVSVEVEAEIRELGKDTRRLAGDTRYGTSLAIAEELLAVNADASRATVFLATGRNYPDALAAGVPVAAANSILVLVDGVDTAGSAATYDWLRTHADEIGELRLIGGKAAIATSVAKKAGSYANWPKEPAA